MTSPTQPAAGGDRPQLRVVSQAPVTEGETPIGGSDRTTTTAHASTRDARPRARAREEPDRPITEREQARRDLPTWIRNKAADWATWAHPPDVWEVDRPSLRKQFHYAVWGEQHPETGLLRWLSITFCCLGLIPQAVAYYVAWAAERPGRLLSLYVLLAVVMQIPAVRTVLTAVAAVLTAPFAWL